MVFLTTRRALGFSLLEPTKQWRTDYETRREFWIRIAIRYYSDWDLTESLVLILRLIKKLHVRVVSRHTRVW
jgi:hypothetical protein